MIKEPKFEHLKSDKLPAGPVRRGSKSRVIKNTAVIMDEQVQIIQKRQGHLTKGTSRVTPILDNNEIIGVVHECSCGERTEILFELEDTSS